MEYKKIVYSLIAFLLLGSIHLSYQESRQSQNEYRSAWWALYFTEPKSRSLDFTVENHGPSDNFQWIVSSDNKNISEGEVKIKAGESKNITPKTAGVSGKIIITVSSGDGKKEIYKNI